MGRNNRNSRRTTSGEVEGSSFKSNRNKKVDSRGENKNRSGRNVSTYAEKENADGNLRCKLEAQTETQGLMISTISTNTITSAIGPAGTGKTCVATLYASTALHKKEFRQIVITRPIVEIGRTIGHLPGTVEEKYEPYLVPFKEHFIQAFGKSGYEARIGKSIKPVAINFLQGHTWNDSIILIDEVQNMTVQEMYMVLTRIGLNSKLIMTGDLKQTATKSLLHDNGLHDFLTRYNNNKNLFERNDIGVVEFTKDDIVRSDIVRRIIEMYDV